ncbi:hypothetical protein JCM5353_000878 [Sporobolomyces roseus]
MSYNGVGLSTPRGSGTSGHIQANRSTLRSRQQFDHKGGPQDFKQDANTFRQPDQSILEHERKRRIEAKCFELQVTLEDEGLISEEKIQEQVDELRQKLLSEQGSGAKQGFIKPSERHELAQAKQVQDEKFRKALGIKSDHVEGLAFDREAQAEIKRQKQEDREKAKEERAKIQADLEKARERALKERNERMKVQDEERREHEEQMRRERREHEDRMKSDRRKMEQELEARRRGAPPTAETRGDLLVDDPSHVLSPAPNPAPDLVLYLALVPLLLEDVTPIPVPPHLPLVQIVKDPFLLPVALVEDVHLQDQGPGHPIAIDRGVEVGVIQDREARAAVDHHHAGGSGGIVRV